jgi:ArsR family transcriptional regulator
VSQHLKVLKDAGLIVGDVEPPRVCYCLDERTLDELKRAVAAL